MKTPAFKPKKITNHGNECWRIDIPASYSPTGKRTRPIYTTKAEAEADSRKLRTQAQRFGNQLPPIPHDLHATVVKAVKLLEPHDISLEKAVTEFLKRLEKTKASISYEELVDRVVKHKVDQGRRTIYVKDVRQKGRHFIHFFGEKKICDIGTLEIDNAIASLEISPTSKQVYRRYLRLIFNKALEWNLIERNPVPPNKKDLVRKREPKIFSAAQVTRLLNGATEELLPYFSLAVFCGIRPKEITRLNWEDINFDKRVIELSSEQTKTHCRRLIKIEDTPYAWLKRFEGKTGSVIPSSFREKFDSNRKSSGLFEEWSSDVLRHTCATYHATYHENYEKTSFMLGHDVATLKRFYFRPVLSEDAEEFWNITPDSFEAAVWQRT